jgi:hypothetical protein
MGGTQASATLGCNSISEAKNFFSRHCMVIPEHIESLRKSVDLLGVIGAGADWQIA